MGVQRWGRSASGGIHHRPPPVSTATSTKRHVWSELGRKEGLEAGPSKKRKVAAKGKGKGKEKEKSESESGFGVNARVALLAEM